MYRRFLLLFLLVAGCTPAVETFTVYTPAEDGDHYVNNAVVTWFKGAYYCMWQCSAQDEDAPDTHLVYSRSRDGKRWSEPQILVSNTDSTFSTAGGWKVCGDTLIAFVNSFSEIQAGVTAHYCTSADGVVWSALQPVRMADGTQLNGILEQDIHTLPDGRLVDAAHFSPGLKARPIYSDDPSGRSGWHVGRIEMEDRGNQSRGIEPSLYLRPDGTLVMFFRDQASSFRKLAAESHDRGESWTAPRETEIPDGRTKQCAGNLPDGRAFYIGNPVPAKDRTTLAYATSVDGITFSAPVAIRTPEDLPLQQYEGKYKTLGYSYPKAFLHGEYLYVSYSENKERIVVTRLAYAKMK